nr:hypothetical protein [Pseudomonas sp. A46]
MKNSRVLRWIFSDGLVDEDCIADLLLDAFYNTGSKSFVLDALEINRGALIKAAGSMFLLSRFDLIVIPVAGGINEIDRALDTFELIKSCEPSAIGKVVFCINRYPADLPLVDSVESLKKVVEQPRVDWHYLKECVRLLESTGAGFIVVPELGSISKTRSTGLTLHELVERSTFRKPTEGMCKTMHYIHSRASEVKEVLQGIYTRIDSLIKVSP